MIVFASNPGLVQPLQEAFPKQTLKVYNLSSLYSGYDSITSLITGLHEWSANGVNVPEALARPEIDIAYWELIMKNNKMFNDLMKLVLNSFEGFVCMVLVKHDEYRDAVLESIIKLIQQRYGFTPWVIQDEGDIEVLEEPEYTAQGLVTLDEDRKRYHMMCEAGQVETVLDPINK